MTPSTEHCKGKQLRFSHSPTLSPYVCCTLWIKCAGHYGAEKILLPNSASLWAYSTILSGMEAWTKFKIFISGNAHHPRPRATINALRIRLNKEWGMIWSAIYPSMFITRWMKKYPFAPPKKISKKVALLFKLDNKLSYYNILPLFSHVQNGTWNYSRGDGEEISLQTRLRELVIPSG